MNELNGTLPPELGKLSILQQLNVSSNKLTGPLPQELGKSHLLYSLDLSFNSLNGSLPNQLASLQKLQRLLLQGNHLGGSIPDWWSNLSELLQLNLGQNQFQAVILWRFLSPKTRPTSTMATELPSKLYQIMQATEYLNEKYVIGKGGKGVVYRVELPSGQLYALKTIELAPEQRQDMSMKTEIKTAGEIRHRNLVKLLEFWQLQDRGIILYEYMSNGSLNDVLHEMKPPPLLGWDIRYKIATGTAHGLSYLHNGLQAGDHTQRYQARSLTIDSSSFSVMGTLGYIAPERGHTTRMSEKMDVYSYGVVLLELITRKKALDPSFGEGIDIVRWVKSCSEGEDVVIDEELGDESIESTVKEEILGMIWIALKCTENKADDRPSMIEVVEMLKGIRPKN
ncbi:hypothetical protein KI387_043386 [Taxus chinensis]|uniref:Protein kinase domain-containing protein n=1 Tax=Taxus chinensis TaxID=29808 RepID=A0AA38C6T8_TAXCH|nr:hypothetical protein KI387_043386 [Taxus chinensis]